MGNSFFFESCTAVIFISCNDSKLLFLTKFINVESNAEYSLIRNVYNEISNDDVVCDDVEGKLFYCFSFPYLFPS
jgi:hypothetical protein